MDQRKTRIATILIFFISFILIFFLPTKLIFATFSKTISINNNKISKIHSKIRQNGEFVVSLHDKGKWQNIGSLPFDRYFQTKKLTFPKPDNTESLSIRILQKGGGASHIDRILVNGHSPIKVSHNLPVSKLSDREFDIIESTHLTIEFKFNLFKTTLESLNLELSGRIESKNLLTEPIKYPTTNALRPITQDSEFFKYKLGSQFGRFKIDGIISNEELGKPLFKSYYPVDSGHPQGSTYAWVKDDGKHLFVAIDFTADNTYDDELDYVELYSKTSSGVKKFRVSVPNQKWGTPAYTYTDKVPYQHKTYEMNVPLSELKDKTDKSEHLELAFAAYGTVAVANKGTVEIAFDPSNDAYLAAYDNAPEAPSIDLETRPYDTTGDPIRLATLLDNDVSPDVLDPSISFDSTNNRFLVAWHTYPYDDIYGIILKANGTKHFGQFPICTDSNDQNTPPDTAFDPNNSRFLVVWEDYRSGSRSIHGQFVDTSGSLFDQNNDPSADLTDPTVNFPIVDDSYGSPSDPKIVFDSLTNRYLLLFKTSEFGDDKLFGQFLDDSADSSGDVFEISAGSSVNKDNPVLAFNSRNGRFIAVWEDDRNTGTTGKDIYGQIIKPDGSLFDHNNDGTSDSFNDNFVISEAIRDESGPSVAFNKTSNRFIVNWLDQRDVASENEVYQQLVKTDGSLDGTNDSLSINSGGNDSPKSLSTASNPACNNNLLVYIYNNNEVGTRLNGACSTAPVLDWLDDKSSGVNPETGTSGSTFNFLVSYTSASNTAPSTARLYIVKKQEVLIDIAKIPVYFSSDRSLQLPSPLIISITGISLIILIYLLGRRVPGLNQHIPAISMFFIIAAIIWGCASSENADESENNNETPGITVTPTSGLIVHELGGMDTFTVKLDSAPSSDVSMDVSSDSPAEGTIDISSLNFTADNWNVAQTVTVTGVQDNTDDSDQEFTIITGPTSSQDNSYNNLDPDNVTVTNVGNKLILSVDSSAEAYLQDGDYRNGEQYYVQVTLTDAGTYEYRFIFNDGSKDATGDPIDLQSLTVAD